MAKKINKVIARLTALEKTVAGLLTGTRPRRAKKAREATKARKAKKAKASPAKKRKVTKKPVPKPIAEMLKANVVKKAKVAKKAKVLSRKAAPTPVKKAKRNETKHVLPPTVEQLAPSGAPNFAQAVDRV